MAPSAMEWSGRPVSGVRSVEWKPAPLFTSCEPGPVTQPLSTPASSSVTCEYSLFLIGSHQKYKTTLHSSRCRPWPGESTWEMPAIVLSMQAGAKGSLVSSHGPGSCIVFCRSPGSSWFYWPCWGGDGVNLSSQMQGISQPMRQRRRRAVCWRCAAS